MAAMVLDIGDVAVFEWQLSLDGVAVDPSSISLDVLPPSGTVIHAEWAGGSGLVIRVQAGVYRFSHVLDEDGYWWYRWTGTGTVQAADEGHLRVNRQRVVSV